MSYDDDRENLYLNLKIGENEDENEKEKEVEQEDDEDEEDEKENEQEDGQEDEQVEKYNDGTHNFSIKMIGSQSNEIRESYDEKVDDINNENPNNELNKQDRYEEEKKQNEKACNKNNQKELSGFFSSIKELNKDNDILIIKITKEKKNNESLSRIIIINDLGRIKTDDNEVNPHNYENIPPSPSKPIILGSSKRTCTFLIFSENETSIISGEHCHLLIENFFQGTPSDKDFHNNPKLLVEDRSTYGTYMKLTNMHEINELKEKLSNQILEITVISNDRIEDNLLIKNVDIIIYPREFEKKVKECKGCEILSILKIFLKNMDKTWLLFFKISENYEPIIVESPQNLKITHKHLKWLLPLIEDKEIWKRMVKNEKKIIPLDQEIYFKVNVTDNINFEVSFKKKIIE